MKSLVSLILVFSLNQVLAEEAPNVDPRTYISAGAMIELTAYDPKTHIYTIKRADVPDAVLKARAENIAKAVKTLPLKTLLEKPNSLFGTMYSVDEDLLIFPPPEKHSKKK